MMLGIVLFAVVSASQPNIVLVSVDTLRADHLGCYGYSFDTSPNIDALAKRSLVFDNVICEVPLTGPSFSSMMTSLFPRLLGTVRNGVPIPDSAAPLAELLKGAGYETFCVQSNWTLKAKLSHLNRGFDVYEDAFHKKRWGILKSERYADEVTRIALALLAKRDSGKPFFAWIHYSDPHAPYRIHRAFRPHKERRHKDKVAAVHARYDSEIAYADSHIGKLLDALPKENTFVVFLADHGESLYEHDYLGHGRRIYQDNLHIPFMISGPGITAERTDCPGRGIDAAPTILALAGVTPASGMLGVNLLAKQRSTARHRVIETYGGAVPRFPGARALMLSKPPMRQGVLVEDWKLILDGDKPELFNLRDDSKEMHNLAGSDVDRVEQLKQVIEQWDKMFPRNKTADAPLSPEDLEALRSFGYLE